MIHCRVKLSDVRPGNVYEAKGGAGWKEGTRYWLVVSVRKGKMLGSGGCYVFGLNEHWEVVSARGRTIWGMEERPLLFRMKSFKLDFTLAP